MPLTGFQRAVLGVIGASRTPDNYLAGGAAIHFEPNSIRYSGDLDSFQDSVDRVATAYADDEILLTRAGFELVVEISQPGFVRAIVSRDSQATRIDWARDSAWRFMPPRKDSLGGYLLHEIDLAVNKTLALAGRDEARDFVDMIYLHANVLPLAGLVWAATGKDPGFTPLSLLELLKRRGRPRPEEIARLDLSRPFDITEAKTRWLGALDDVDSFVRSRPAAEAGCLYFSQSRQAFVLPGSDDPRGDIIPHYVRPGGVLLQPADQSVLADWLTKPASAGTRDV
ncbi:MAG: hypothetical protein ACT4OZ_04825 [Gemmatimonadota bacterium]